MTTRRALPAYGTSLALHSTLAFVLCLVHFSPESNEIANPIESYLAQERSFDEFTSELARTSAAFEAVEGDGAAAALAGGGAGGSPALSHARLDVSEQLRDPTVAISLGDTTVAIRDQLADDLGEGQVAGEPTAVVGGYGAAMSRITQEIIRMLREERLIVAWMFDESESMKDDQREIQDEFHRVYDELGVFIDGEKKSTREGDMLLSAIHSFGRDHRQITEKPTGDISEIRRAIDKIGVDDTGRENMFAAVNKVLELYRPLASKTHRKLAIIIVSDESGDDGDGPLLDEVIVKARRQKSPVYVLGRESIFGYPYAHIRWKDPKYGLTHWLRINRGPETAFPELLQFDGMHQRRDAHPSGFAPYEQARLTKETGGIFFVLPGEEQHIVNPADLDQRKFAFLDMKEYAPELVRRRDYEERRAHSRFRTAVWDVVRLLNPFVDKELNIRDDWYSTERDRFIRQGEQAFKRGLRDMSLLNQAVQALEKVKPLRESESSPRWRANFDLAAAQVRAYRVRLFQFLLIMDGYLHELPKPASAQHNVWNLQRSREMTSPTDRQVTLTKVDLDELQQQLDQAKQLFEFVRRSHPGTPWANRAEHELRFGFGMRWRSGFRDPRYDRRDITFPSL